MPLGPASYDVHVGFDLLPALPGILERACPAERYALIADSTVATRYGPEARDTIGAFRPCELFSFPAGERNKGREQWAALSDAMLAAGLGRDAAVVALGGGVTGDLAGFVAATYLRGIPYVQVPTTLLAMIDSSVGGKTGVDTSHGKNLVGAFHQPRAVIADVRTLGTLPPAHLAAGVAEALKHGAIADADYFATLVRLREEIHAADPATLAGIVARSVEIKAEVVGEDERDHGKRAILNFGHTVAHAIETVTGYETLHGQAVAIGMVLEAQLGAALGITARAAPGTLKEALQLLRLPVSLPPASPGELVSVMTRDKKSRGGTVKFAFLKTVGQAARQASGEWTFSATEESIKDALRP